MDRSLSRVAKRYLRDIALRLVATPESVYLQEFVTAVGEITGANMVLVSRIRGHDAPVEAYAVYDSSGQATSYNYPLRGTPCAEVFEGNRPFLRIGGLQQAFPDDPDLGEFNLNSYVGMPLNHADGKCFGLIAALWSDAPSDPEAVLEVFQTVEPRLVSSAYAVERAKGREDALRHELEVASKRLDIALEASKIGVWDYDLLNDIVFWDERQYQLFGLPPDGKSSAMPTGKRRCIPTMSTPPMPRSRKPWMSANPFSPSSGSSGRTAKFAGCAAPPGSWRSTASR